MILLTSLLFIPGVQVSRTENTTIKLEAKEDADNVHNMLFFLCATYQLLGKLTGKLEGVNENGHVHCHAVGQHFKSWELLHFQISVAPRTYRNLGTDHFHVW